MNLRLLGLALAAGLATFLLVGVVVTELLASRIAFSLLVGIPAGLFAGAVVATLVAWASDAGGPPERRRLATAFGTFAATFLLVLVVGAVVPVGMTIGVLAGVVVGVVAAVGSYVRARGRTPDDPASDGTAEESTSDGADGRSSL